MWIAGEVICGSRGPGETSGTELPRARAAADSSPLAPRALACGWHLEPQDERHLVSMGRASKELT